MAEPPAERGVVRYWRGVAARALTDSLAFVGTTRKKLIVSVAISLVSGAILAVVLTWVFGDQEAFKTVLGKLQWAFIGLLSELLMPVLFYGFFFIRTPFVLHEEAVTELKEIAADLKKQMQSLQEELLQIRLDRVAEATRQHASAEAAHQAGLTHVAMNKLKHELDRLRRASRDSRVPSGPAMDYARMVKKHAESMRAGLAEWTNRAILEASKVGLSNYLATLDDLDQIAADHDELDRFAQMQAEAVGAILHKLG